MKSFLAYMGGKSLLTGKIISKIPDHNCYVEVFAGAAWLLFKKEECSSPETHSKVQELLPDNGKPKTRRASRVRK